MEKEEFDLMEVKPSNAGWYYVTLFQFEKILPEAPDYIKDWLEFDGNNWIYGNYENNSYVCFIHRNAMMKYQTVKILKEETYRSKPVVNITDDYIRVTLTCSINEWRNIKKEILRDKE